MRETYDALLLHDVMQLLHTCLVQSCTRISVTYVGLYINCLLYTSDAADE